MQARRYSSQNVEANATYLANGGLSQQDELDTTARLWRGSACRVSHRMQVRTQADGKV